MISKSKKFIIKHLFNNKPLIDYKYCLFQSFLVFVSIFLVLLLVSFFDAVAVTSLGASCLILFAAPHTNAARIRSAIGGYFCGTVSGLFFNLLYTNALEIDFFGTNYLLILICAAAVGVSMLLMVITNMVHPSAAALALGLSFDPACFHTAVMALGSITLLCIIKAVFKKRLRNLI